ncbi:MAG TPA: PTS sugar transporter subunit IIA [Chthoniobacterales bacterium]|nr:PTS sugar transporter subunit IIA [Chthoniobacterales bacterium]
MAIALADLINPKQITLHLQANTHPEAVRELVDLLAATNSIRNPTKFLDELRGREAVNSTYAADGVAFPHARTKLVDQIGLAIGRSEAGIPWTGKGELARLIFLIAVPERLISDYLVVVGAIARITRDGPLRTLLLHADSVEEFVATLLSAPSI